MRIARSVTRIRRFDSPIQPPLHWDEDVDSDSGDDITDDGQRAKMTNSKKGRKGCADRGDETEMELPETSDEIARVYWKWFSPDRIIFRGRITTRNEFLPKTGKMKGQVNSRQVSYWKRG